MVNVIQFPRHTLILCPSSLHYSGDKKNFDKFTDLFDKDKKGEGGDLGDLGVLGIGKK